MKTTVITLYISIRALGWPGVLSIRSNILKGVFFFRAIGLRTRLKIFSELCCEQMCCDPGFVVPFTEHRQSRFSMTLKCPRTFEIMSEYWLQLKVSSYIIFSYEHQPILWSFEARYWLFLSSYESPRWYLPPIEGIFIYIEDLFSAATFVNYLRSSK